MIRRHLPPFGSKFCNSNRPQDYKEQESPSLLLSAMKPINVIAIILAGLLMVPPVSANLRLHRELPLPAHDKIEAFSNGLLPATGRRYQVSKSEFISILSRGRVLKQEEIAAEENRHLRNVEGLLRGKPLADNEGADSGYLDDCCDGIATNADGVVYFWKVTSPRTLTLETEAGETCSIVFDFELQATKQCLADAKRKR